jgi:uncharacterized protein YbgA (DUF1722 family)
MAYDQNRMRELGRIVANASREPLAAVIDRYEAGLSLALSRPPRTAAHVNVLMHALGHVSDGLSSREKAQFLDSLESFRNRRLPASALAEVLRSWSARFDNLYLADQTYLSPFPPELIRLERPSKRRRRREGDAG